MKDNLVEEIEANYEVEKILWNGINIWPIFKTKLHFSTISLQPEKVRGRNTLTILLKSIVYGISSLFRLSKMDFYCFSNSNRRVLIAGNYEERIIGGFLKEFPNSLLVENPVPTGHKKRENVLDKNILSESLFFLIQFFLVKYFLLRKKKFQGVDVLDTILTEQGLKLDYNQLFYRFLAQKVSMDFFLKLHKPKAGIFVCAYIYFGYIHSFKNHGIPVIEFQHGLINNKHVSYNYSKKISIDLFPDYLFSFGTAVKQIINGSFLNIKNIIPVGYYYVSNSVTNKINDEEILEDLKKYKRIIAYTANNAYEEELLKFLNIIAVRNTDVKIWYIPRYRNNQYSFNCADNLRIITSNVITYDLIRVAGIHSTIYSTCALEALALGRPNILVNFDNLSKMHLGALLAGNKYTYIVDSIDQFENALNALNNKEGQILEDRKIKESINDYFVTGSHGSIVREEINKIIST